MKCAYPEDQIALFIERDLTERERREVERHLLVCPECRKLASELRESQTLWKSLRGERVDSESLRELRQRVLVRVQDAEASLGWALRLERFLSTGMRRRYAMAAAAALIVSGLAVAAVWSSDRISGSALREPARVAEAPVPEVGREDLSLPPPGWLGELERARPVKTPVARDLPNVGMVALASDVSAPIASRNTEPSDQILVKMLTDDPDIVIYWVVDEADPQRSE